MSAPRREVLLPNRGRVFLDAGDIVLFLRGSAKGCTVRLDGPLEALAIADALAELACVLREERTWVVSYLCVDAKQQALDPPAPD